MSKIGSRSHRPLRSGAAALALASLLPAAGSSAAAREIVLRWLPPAGTVDGYRVHLGGAPSRYDEIVALGPVPIDPDGIGRATLSLDSTRDHYVALSAYNGAGASALSNEIVVPASACDLLACDDAEACTADDCGAEGCTHAPLPDGSVCAGSTGAFGICAGGVCGVVECGEASHCDDADACNGVESCSASGACVAGEPLRCGRPSQCSVPGCDPARGCIEIPVADGTPCDDRKRSTLDDRCRAGVCEGVHKREEGRRPK